VRKALRTYARLIGFAATTLTAYKLRSLFVALAVALGVASLTVIVTSVDGAQRKAREIVEMFGPDAAFILGGDIRSRAVGKRRLTLSWEDARVLRRSLPGAYLVVPMRGKSNVTVKAGGENMVAPVVVGATASYAEVWNWPLAEGRDISREDVERGAKVGLIGTDAARELFGEASPVGRVVFLNDIPVEIIGRLSYRGFGGGGRSLDERIIMPLTTMTKRFNMNRKYFRALRVKFRDPENMSAHVENMRSLLRRLHDLEPGEEDDFTILTADEILKFIGMLKGSLVLFLGVTAAVAMLVGGFVLANLLHLSVSERTPEIGVRRALGAKRIHVTLQFLAEACLLTLIGAAVGLGIGWGLGRILSALEILQIQYSLKVFVISALSALAIAVVFGLRPARRAASLDPVQALRGGE
jgi:putative ABC transport system permease protein